jgi:hypothetical protein
MRETVNRFATTSPSPEPLSSRRPLTWSAALRTGRSSRRTSGSEVFSWSATLGEAAAEVGELARGPVLGGEHRAAVAQQRHGLRQRVPRRLGELRGRVQQVLQRQRGARERGARSPTTVRRSSSGTDRTSVSRLPTSSSTPTGVVVRASGIVAPPASAPPPAPRGRRSTYCSPIGDRLRTAASTSAGMAGAAWSMSSWTSTPDAVSVSGPTRPTLTPGRSRRPR